MTVKKIEDFKQTRSGPVFVLGNGPSLDDVDFSIDYSPTIGVNRSWRKVPSVWHCIPPTDCYFKEIARRQWYPINVFVPGRRDNAVINVRRFQDPMRPIDPEIFVDIPYVDVPREKRGRFPHVNFSYTGLMAIELAWYMGFAPIYLLGFDGGNVGHFETGNIQDKKASYMDHNRAHEVVARRIPAGIVFNCNAKSDITTWPYSSLCGILERKADA